MIPLKLWMGGVEAVGGGFTSQQHLIFECHGEDTW